MLFIEVCSTCPVLSRQADVDGTTPGSGAGSAARTGRAQLARIRANPSTARMKPRASRPTLLLLSAVIGCHIEVIALVALQIAVVALCLHRVEERCWR